MVMLEFGVSNLTHYLTFELCCDKIVIDELTLECKVMPERKIVHRGAKKTIGQTLSKGGSRMKYKILSTTALIPFTLTMTAMSQDAAVEDGSSDVRKLATVTVTAQKREQSAQDIPVAVSAISGDQFLDRGFTDATDLSKLAPNFVAAEDRGDTNLSIRGVGSRVRGSTPAVAVHIDGVYQPRAAMANLTQVDLERVEVLRGPQGTLYGRNANGGAVNFITVAPSDELEGYALARYGNYGESRVQGAVNVPVSDTFAVRLSGDRWDRREGTVEHVNGGQDLNEGSSNLFRIRADWEVTESVDLSLLGTYADREGPLNYFLLTEPPSPVAIGLNLAPRGVPVNLATAPLSLAPNTTAHDAPTFSDREYTSLAAVLEADLSDTLSLRSITAFQTFEESFGADFDATGLDLAPQSRGVDAETFTQEINLIYETDRVSAILGGFYMDDTSNGFIQFDFGPTAIALTQTTTNPDTPARAPNDPPPGSVSRFNTLQDDNSSIAIFADATVDVTESLSVFGGIRYSEDEQEVTLRHTSEFSFPVQSGPFAPGDYRLYICPQNPNPGPPLTTPQTAALLDPVQDSVKFTSTTPRVGVNYRVNDDSSVYASYSQGFKTGGFNASTGCGDGFESETVNSIEIGTKNTFLDGNLVLNASAFFYDYENLQVEQLVGVSFSFENAPGAEVLGFELDGAYAPDEHWRFDGSFSIQQSEFTEFSNVDTVNYFTRDGNGDVVVDPVTGAVVPFLQDLSGNPLPYAPDMTANLGVSYTTDPNFAGGYFLLTGNINHTGELNFREFDAPGDRQEAYTLLDAAIAWTHEDTDWTVRVFGRNLTDEEYLVSSATASTTNSRFGVWGTPQQFGVELRKRF